VRRDGIVEAGVGHPPARCRVVVLAKEPEPGRVKTRLCPPLLPNTAAECHEAFVVDTLSRVRRAAPEAEAVLAVSPAGVGSQRLREIALARGWRCVEQVSGDLGCRMEALLSEGVKSACRVLLLGADTPDLPVKIVHDACAALRTSPVVLGPATDGGYYLVGCRDRVPPIFGPEMEWGTSRVWGQTLARLRESDSGGQPVILPHWSDVDDWPGLLALAARIERQSEHERDENDEPPLATIELLRRLRAAGFSL
jgi:rSAM/selenodomain-associated transferase 1